MIFNLLFPIILNTCLPERLKFFFFFIFHPDKTLEVVIFEQFQVQIFLCFFFCVDRCNSPKKKKKLRNYRKRVPDCIKDDNEIRVSRPLNYAALLRSNKNQSRKGTPKFMASWDPSSFAWSRNSILKIWFIFFTLDPQISNGLGEVKVADDRVTGFARTVVPRQLPQQSGKRRHVLQQRQVVLGVPGFRQILLLASGNVYHDYSQKMLASHRLSRVTFFFYLRIKCKKNEVDDWSGGCLKVSIFFKQKFFVSHR